MGHRRRPTSCRTAVTTARTTRPTTSARPTVRIARATMVVAWPWTHRTGLVVRPRRPSPLGPPCSDRRTRRRTCANPFARPCTGRLAPRRGGPEHRLGHANVIRRRLVQGFSAAIGGERPNRTSPGRATRSTARRPRPGRVRGRFGIGATWMRTGAWPRRRALRPSDPNASSLPAGARRRSSPSRQESIARSSVRALSECPSCGRNGSASSPSR